MTRYATSRVMWEVTRDQELAATLCADPAAVLADRDLTDDEWQALSTQDVRGLFELGVHPFVLFHFALRLAGGNSMTFMQGYVGSLEGLTTGDLES